MKAGAMAAAHALRPVMKGRLKSSAVKQPLPREDYCDGLGDCLRNAQPAPSALRNGKRPNMMKQQFLLPSKRK